MDFSIINAAVIIYTGYMDSIIIPVEKCLIK